jgi:fatty acid-binding protein DegV
MSKPIEALAEEYLLQLEQNEAFSKVVVLPYASYAEGALRKAKAETTKPADQRNLQIIADCLREHIIYVEISTLVSGQLAALRQGRAAKEKAGQGGQKDLQVGDENA